MSHFSYVYNQLVAGWSCQIANMIIGLTFTIAFGILTGDSSHYVCSTASSPYMWSFATFLFLLISFVLEFILVLSYFLSSCCQSTECYFRSMGLLQIHSVVYIICGIVSCIGLSYSYSQEVCGDLGSLDISWIVIFLISLLAFLILLYSEYKKDGNQEA